MADLQKYSKIREFRINLESNAIFIHKEIYVMDGEQKLVLEIESSSYELKEDRKAAALTALEGYPILQNVTESLFSNLINTDVKPEVI